MDWKRGGLAFIILLVLIIILFLSFEPQKCPQFNCFQSHMAQCKKVTYINEEDEASWQYNIIGLKGDQCDIEVTLLNAKQGDLSLRRYESLSMMCSYKKGIIAYPEKNLDICTGPLKEGLQTIMIEQLYRYIVDNIDAINKVSTN